MVQLFIPPFARSRFGGNTHVSSENVRFVGGSQRAQRLFERWKAGEISTQRFVVRTARGAGINQVVWEPGLTGRVGLSNEAIPVALGLGSGAVATLVRNPGLRRRIRGRLPWP